MWGQAFGLPSGFWLALLAPVRNAGQKPCGDPEGLAPHKRHRLSEKL
jgi:hypothetical protein